jgi:DNA-directed RNA polymerase subunit M/transcription elongation factor TFIIS
MQCRKCEYEYQLSDVHVAFTAHDKNLLDVTIKCPKCEHAIMIKNYISEKDFVDYFPHQHF